ncbi:capsid protein [Miresoil virus 123]|uniref:Capsid protein n=1 Tax=Miresoil virus 123 TaxID=2911452 RepID=A0A9E8M5P5_9VIRU|nr:capsid protein [Miresoil virus 123]
MGMKRRRHGAISIGAGLGAAAANMFKHRRLMPVRSASSKQLSAFRTKRRGGSKIKSKRNKKRTENSQLATGSDVTFTKFALKRPRFGPKLKGVSAVNYYRYVVGQRVTATVGQQGVATLGLNGSTGGATASSLYSVADLSSILAAITSASSTSAGYQFLVQKGTSEYYITNSSNANLVMWLYDCIPRKDMQTSDAEYAYPDYAWAAEKLQVGTTGTTGYLTPFATPFESAAFTHNYKVIAVKKVSLSPGVLHRHVVKSFQPRWISDSLWNNQYSGALPSTNIIAIGKRSVYTLVVIAGAPAHVAATPTSAYTGIGPCAIDIVLKKTYEYRFALDLSKSVYQANLLPTTGNFEEVAEATAAFTTVVNN